MKVKLFSLQFRGKFYKKALILNIMDQNEYLARTLRLKSLIEADSTLLERAAKAFAAVYGDRINSYAPVALPTGLIELGSGSHHIVIGLGRTIVDPSNGKEIPLAVKLRRENPYGITSPFHLELEEQVGAYHAAFEEGRNPPYFVMIVNTEGLFYGRSRNLAGILTEDVSNGKAYQLFETPNSEFCDRILPGGLSERIFLDPGYGLRSYDGEKYSVPSARIDLR